MSISRNHYLQTLAKEPFSFDFSSVKKEFKEDFGLSGKMKGEYVVAWTTCVWEKGCKEFPGAVVTTIRIIAYDIFAGIKATFELAFVNWNEDGVKNFAFSVWNLTVADHALVLSVFVGILLPFTRELATVLHKGNVDLPLFAPKESAEEAEKKAKAKKEAEDKLAHEKREVEEKQAQEKKEAEEKQAQAQREAQQKKETEEKQAQEQRDAQPKNETEEKQAQEQRDAQLKKESEEKAPDANATAPTTTTGASVQEESFSDDDDDVDVARAKAKHVKFENEEEEDEKEGIIPLNNAAPTDDIDSVMASMENMT